MFAPTLSTAALVVLGLAMSMTLGVICGNAAPFGTRLTHEAPIDISTHGISLAAADAAPGTGAHAVATMAPRKIRVILPSPFDN